MKREMEEQALKTMGENKASYMMKDAIGQVPDSDQQVSRPLPLEAPFFIEYRVDPISRMSRS